MNDLLTFLQHHPWAIIIFCAVSGYLIGSVSFARLVYFMVKKSKSYEPFSETIPLTGEKFDSSLISATWVSKKIGKRFGMITAFADMLKVAIPTLAVKLIFPGTPYFLVIALLGICGHNYPLYYRFVGGRGESPMMGALFVINWFGVFLANAASWVLGYLSGSILVMRFGWYVLLIFWYWYYFNDLYYVIFMVLANFFYWFAMRKDLAKFRQIKKSSRKKLREEDISDFILMGRGTGRFLDHYSAYALVRKWVFSRGK